MNNLSTEAYAITFHSDLRKLTPADMLGTKYLAYYPIVREQLIPAGTPLSQAYRIQSTSSELAPFFAEIEETAPLCVGSAREDLARNLATQTDLLSGNSSYFGWHRLLQFSQTSTYIASDLVGFSLPAQQPFHILTKEAENWTIGAIPATDRKLAPDQYSPDRSDHLYFGAIIAPYWPRTAISPQAVLVEVNPAVRCYMQMHREEEVYPKTEYCYGNAFNTLEELCYDHNNTCVGAFDGTSFQRPSPIFFYALMQASGRLLMQSRNRQEHARGKPLVDCYMHSASSLNAIVDPCIVQVYALAVPV
ncbi:hypothetical protein HY641_04230 [Candidatus Woesearchaeota archaeon]|nr:hypothetical protein [Candidatus Woesearchaeota archaeon]